MALLGLFRRKPHERAGFALYTEAVALARDPALFETLGVPDTIQGRFDAIGLHVALVLRRCRAEPDPAGAALAQAVFDAMFADMDISLREMGVSDLAVGKRMKKLWEGFHGRALAYEAALDAGDGAALAEAIGRNLHGGAPPAGAAEALAARAQALAAQLAARPFAELLAGRLGVAA
jgi:cytochrome b pre-mRNA-processing protein 3